MSNPCSMEVLIDLFKKNNLTIQPTWVTKIHTRVSELLKVEDPSHLELVRADIRRLLDQEGASMAFTFKNTATNKVMVVGFLYDPWDLPTLTILSDIMDGASMFGSSICTTVSGGTMFVYTTTLQGNKATLKKLTPVADNGERVVSNVRTYHSVPVSTRFADRLTAPDNHSWLTMTNGHLTMSVWDNGDIYNVDFGLVA